MSNPFYGFGGRVRGDRLVGRHAELDRFTDYLDTHNGSLSIIGVGKIGKSSLTRAIVDRVLQHGNPVAHAWITLATIPTAVEVYGTLINEIIEFCERREIALPAIVERELQEPEAKALYPAFRRCRRFLQALARSKIQSLVVFDEFDAVRDYEQSKLFLQQLRELIDFREETGFVAVMVSRRSLYHLERQISGISSLDGVCEKHFVAPLSHEGLQEMCLRCGTEWNVTESEVNLLGNYSGGHPFLSEMALCRAWEQKSVERGIEESRADLFSYFEHLQEMFVEDEIFEQLLQAAVGPVFHLKMEAIERLVRYGVLKVVPSPDGIHYRAWCEPFQVFLERTAREMPLWTMWRDTENALRWFIKNACQQRYGPSWLEDLARKHSSVNQIVNGSETKPGDGCRQRMLRERENFGLGASDDVLDYAYPMDLWAIVSAEWPVFRDVLRKEKAYWNERFALLAKVRTPTAHNRERKLPQHVLTTAKGYCQELLALIQQPEIRSPNNPSSSAQKT